MLTVDHLVRRRGEFLESIGRPVLLMSGGALPRNYPQNVFPYRADSSFLFFFGEAEPDSAAFFDPEDHTVILFLQDRTSEAALWHGPVPGFEEMRARHGVTRVLSVSDLKSSVQKLAHGRKVGSIAVADPKATARAREITKEKLCFESPADHGDLEAIDAVSRLRLKRSEEEIGEMRAAARVTREAHTLAMAQTRPGVHERQLAGVVEGCFVRHGCVTAYNTILSVRGEILHIIHQVHVAGEGDLLLLDAGAEVKSGYCADVTRTWPVSGRFSAEQRAVYEIVLRANLECIGLVKPGHRYRDIHLHAARTVAEGLVSLGLLRGNVDALVETGAHALFFPHGVGHLLGLDVHDMEAFGDRIAYPGGRKRSSQFGTAYLRLDRDLEPGNCMTIEPGIYFVPAILHDPSFREQFRDQVDFDRAEQFLRMNQGRGFGGIRIEDDVLTTASGAEVLTARIAKTVEEVESIACSAGLS